MVVIIIPVELFKAADNATLVSSLLLCSLTTQIISNNMINIRKKTITTKLCAQVKAWFSS